MATRTFNIIVQEGQGTVDISKNDIRIAGSSQGSPATVVLNLTDTLKLQAVPGTGYKFQKFCISTLCSAWIESNPFINNSVYNNQQETTYYTYFVQNELCSWITGKGGKTALRISDVLELYDKYLGFIAGFKPTIPEIMGCQDYYLGFYSSGDIQTGC